MKIFHLSSKTLRDKAKFQFVTLYHASKEKLGALMPRSSLLRTGRTGLFLSPSYRSTIMDWAAYVRGRKHSNHPLEINRKILKRDIERLEKLPKTEEISRKIEELELQVDKIDKTTSNSEAYHESTLGYSTIYIHTIQCPIVIYKECQKRMDQAYEEDSVKSFGFWGWGAQIFIDAEFLPQLKISNVKEMNVGEFLKEYKDVSVNRQFHSRGDAPWYQKEEWEKQEEEAKERARLRKEKEDKLQYRVERIRKYDKGFQLLPPKEKPPKTYKINLPEPDI